MVQTNGFKMVAESCGHKIKPETLKEGKYVTIEELGEHDYAMKPCSEHVHACALPNLITLTFFCCSGLSLLSVVIAYNLTHS